MTMLLSSRIKSNKKRGLSKDHGDEFRKEFFVKVIKFNQFLIKGGNWMKKFLDVIILLLLAGTIFAWSGHDALTYYILKSLNMDFSFEVPITEYSYENLETREYNLEKASFDDLLGKDYIPGEDYRLFKPVFENSKLENGKAPIWQILSVYSYEPDLGMDQNLELSNLQWMTGGSQGWRHMEYHLFWLRFGEVSESVAYFTELSKKAWEKGNPYWAFRFMGRAIHYFEDIGQPYHTFPAPFCELLKLMIDMNKWMTVFTNYHLVYDYYSGYLLWNQNAKVVEAIKTAKPIKITDPRKDALRLRIYARRKLHKIYYEMKKIMKDDLEVSSEFTPSPAYFDLLTVEGKTKKLEELTADLLGKVASYIKGYLIYMNEEMRWEDNLH